MAFRESGAALKLIGVFWIDRKQSTNRKSIVRTYDSLSMRIQGEGQFAVDGRTLRVGENDLLYIPMSARYTQSTRGETVIAVHFIRYGEAVQTEMDFAHFQNAEPIRECMRELYGLWSEGKPGYRYECTALLYRILYLAASHEEGEGRNLMSESMSAAFEYIHKHYKEQRVSVARLAQLSYMSEVSFRKHFRKRCGVNPNEYIVHLKLDYAAQLLASGLFTVSEVSEKAGFNSPKYFARTFKKRYGIPPSRYRLEGI